jgi:two-component system LytT family sensor kinase
VANIDYLVGMKSRPAGKKVLIILRDLLILILIGNTIGYFINPGFNWSITTVLSNCAFSIGIGFPAWRGSMLISNLLEKRLPWLKFPIKRLVAQITTMILFVTLITFLILSVWVALSDEITFQHIREFAFASIKIVIIFIVLSIIITNGVIFFINWREAAIQQEELKRAHLALQYQSLKSQTNPHFLFNSLSSLVTLINSEPKKATDFVHKLSDVYRYVLEQGQHELVSLTEEVKFLEDYVFLQKIRFGDSLQVSMDLEPKHGLMVLPLSLQMMVENAIKHNEISGDHPLQIRISLSSDHQVVIRNTLNKKETVESSTGLGMENLDKRISFFTKTRIRVEQKADTYTVSIPTIPS